jgi:hypothetical protein
MTDIGRKPAVHPQRIDSRISAVCRLWQGLSGASRRAENSEIETTHHDKSAHWK